MQIISSLRQRRTSGIYEDDTYPHYYSLKEDDSKAEVAYAYQEAVSSRFLLFSKGIKEDYTTLNQYFIGEIEPNYWGTEFMIYDHGLDTGFIEQLPTFVSKKKEMIVLRSLIYQTFERESSSMKEM